MIAFLAFLKFFLSPLGRYVAIAAAVLSGYAYWHHHVAKAAEAKIVAKIEHQEQVAITKKNNKVHRAQDNLRNNIRAKPDRLYDDDGSRRD